MFLSMAVVRGALFCMKPTSATNVEYMFSRHVNLAYRKSQGASLHLLSRPDTWHNFSGHDKALEMSAVFFLNVGGYGMTSIVTCYRLDSLGFNAQWV